MSYSAIDPASDPFKVFGSRVSANDTSLSLLFEALPISSNGPRNTVALTSALPPVPSSCSSPKSGPDVS